MPEDWLCCPWDRRLHSPASSADSLLAPGLRPSPGLGCYVRAPAQSLLGYRSWKGSPRAKRRAVGIGPLSPQGFPSPSPSSVRSTGPQVPQAGRLLLPRWSLPGWSHRADSSACGRGHCKPVPPKQRLQRLEICLAPTQRTPSQRPASACPRCLALSELRKPRPSGPGAPRLP